MILLISQWILTGITFLFVFLVVFSWISDLVDLFNSEDF